MQASELLMDSDQSKRDKPLGRIAVGFLIHSMGIGGAERSIARLINSLDHQRFKPCVICLSHSGPAVEWIQSPDVPVIEIRKTKTIDRATIQRLVDVIRQHEIDIVHSHNWGTLLEASVACAKSGVRHVHAERGTVLGQVDPSGLKMKLRGICARWALSKCSAVVTNSSAVAQRIEKRCWFASSRVKIIPNGIESIPVQQNSAARAKHRAELRIPTDAIVIGSLGRLAEVKGFELAVQALKELPSDSPAFHFLLVGDGPERARLEALADKLQVQDRCHLVGQQDDVGKWLGMMDVYVNTSHSEGMSQSIVEAMSASLPIVATDVGDSGVLVGRDGLCGELVSPGDLEQLVAAVQRMTDSGAHCALGTAAAERQQELFGIQTMANNYQNLYEQVMRQNP